MTVLVVAFALVLMAVVAFALQNTQVASVSFLAWSWQLDVGRVGAIFWVAGAVAAAMLLGADDVRVRMRARDLRRQLRRLEARLAGVEAERDRLASQLDGVAREGEAEAASRGEKSRADGAGPPGYAPDKGNA